MKTDFTINVEESFVQRLKEYAALKQENVSALIEKLVGVFLPNLEPKEPEILDTEDDIPPQVRRLRGIIKLPPDFDEKEARYQALWEKYESL